MNKDRTKGLTCHICKALAWYSVASRGYCGKHRDEAYADAKREGVKSNRTNDAMNARVA